MRLNAIYTNEFTGEVFTDREKCKQAETESKKDFVNKLIADIELIKDICNSHEYCDGCPFADGSGDCVADAFTDRYLDIVHNLQTINN